MWMYLDAIDSIYFRCSICSFCSYAFRMREMKWNLDFNVKTLDIQDIQQRLGILYELYNFYFFLGVQYLCSCCNFQ